MGKVWMETVFEGMYKALGGKDGVVTARNIADAIGVSVDSVKGVLCRAEKFGYVYHKKVGNLNYYYLGSGMIPSKVWNRLLTEGCIVQQSSKD